MFNGKDILITGGTGSFGHAFIKTILERYSPNRLIVFSRDELKQFNMQQTFPPASYPSLRFFLGDVRDEGRLRTAFRGVHYVVHAAALKQVPAAEYNPFEFIKTNIIGAQNLINAAIDCGVEKVVALSTDKAVNPINLYGATKLCSDKLLVAGNAYVGSNTTKFSVVRYGNVLGSRGSVIPLFLKQRESGTLTVTDPRMTRFWITLAQGVEFVLMAMGKMKGGEIFVPKLPTMTIGDLARAICPQCELNIIGSRPGEKIHEILIPRDEARNTVEFDDYYITRPVMSSADTTMFKAGGRAMDENHEYISSNTDRLLSQQELEAIVQQFVQGHF
jgi:UDP-N-acetylglucosamine 4,6-dehydratase